METVHSLERLAHELRNLLAPIGHAAEIMRLKAEGEPLPAADMIERQIRGINRLLDKLLLAQALFTEPTLPCDEKVSMREVLHSAAACMHAQCEARNVELAVSALPSDIEVMGRSTHLVFVVVELIDNALNASPPGTAVRVDILREGQEAVLSVSDGGRGLTQAQLHGIFDQQIEASRPGTPSARSGLGLGLPSVRRIATLLGGAVHAESDGAGQGATFFVRLPVANAEACDADWLRPSRAPDAVVNGGAHAPRRVLVVDDNRALQDSLIALIEELGHHARAVGDGQSALTAVPAWQPHLILLDVHLPDINGFEVARRIRNEPGATNTQICVMSADQFHPVIAREVQAAGIDTCISKLECGAQLRTILASL